MAAAVAKVQEDIKKRAWQGVYQTALEDGFTKEEAKKEADDLWSLAVESVIYDILFPDGE